MSIFGTIMQKIFHSSDPATSNPVGTPTAASAAPDATGGMPATSGVAPGGTASGTPASLSPAPSSVDVEQVLSDMAGRKGGGGNWQSSIVDLLKLLDLDSSMAARKELASELNVHAGADGSAEQNMALHKAVMQKLAENGGKVPESMKG